MDLYSFLGFFQGKIKTMWDVTLSHDYHLCGASQLPEQLIVHHLE